MNRKSRPANAGVIFQGLSCVAVVVAMSCAPLSASTAGGNLIANDTPSYVATAKNLGAEDPARLIEVSIWLQLHNRSQFDALTQSFYDRTSSNYHHWLKQSDIAARFAPTAQEAKTVQQFLVAHDLKLAPGHPPTCMTLAGAMGCSVDATSARDLMTEIRKQNEVAMRKRLLQARKSGELSKDVNVDDYTRYLSSILAGLSIQAANGSTKTELKRTSQMALRHLGY
jgi:hypothetical protein